MKLQLKQVSSLIKVRLNDNFDYPEINSATVLGGERFSYQLAYTGESRWPTVSCRSELLEHIQIYSVENAAMDMPVYDEEVRHCDDYYITKEPGLMPDILMPLSENNNRIRVTESQAKSLWIRVDIPENHPAGEYEIVLSVSDEGETVESVFKLNVLGVNLPKQKLIYTQWLHVDCIATQHNVPVYSEQHWQLIEKYIAAANEVGINMILMPLITPPLDTEIGQSRPNVQLVGIEKQGESYKFDFSKVLRWIDICKRNGVEYYEIAHLFTQWGAKCAPNIWVTENGEEKHMFGWHVAADSPEYVGLLTALLPEFIKLLREQGIAENTYFHISDEPTDERAETFGKARAVAKPLLEDMKIFDATSHYHLYEQGLVEIPVCVVEEIVPFLEKNTPNLWAYQCCTSMDRVSNRILSMPSNRTRIIGVQMYKHGIVGFLQWGFNFYHSQLSIYQANPYITTSACGAFPSGDSFTVYPHKNGCILSIRALSFYEGLQDMAALTLLEQKIGRGEVLKFLEQEAGMDITFMEYPHSDEFLPNLRRKIAEML